MKRRNVHVFLKNKIISLDVIIPFCLELNQQCGIKFIFVVKDLDTYRSIVHNNIVLRDVIDSIGKITLLSKRYSKLRFLSRVITLLYMIYIIFRVNISKDYIIHFGLFNVRPFSLLCPLLKRHRVILSSTSSYGVDNNRNYGFICAGMLLGYSNLWSYLKRNSTRNTPKIVFDRSRNLPSWINYVKINSDKYIESEIGVKLTKTDRIIVFPIGKLNLDITMRHSESFVSALAVLAKYSKEYTIFIKPAIYTNLDYVKKLIQKAENKSKIKINYIFTKLHPAVLSRRAVVSVFVNKATIINEMHNLKVPIVQCLYAFEGELDYLDFISNKADYIVNNSSISLDKVLNRLIKKSDSMLDIDSVQQDINCSLFCK